MGEINGYYGISNLYYEEKAYFISHNEFRIALTNRTRNGLTSLSYNTAILSGNNDLELNLKVNNLEIYSDGVSKMTSFSQFEVYASDYYFGHIYDEDSASGIRFRVVNSSVVGSWENNIRMGSDVCYLLSLTIFSNEINHISLTINNTRGESYFLEVGKDASVNAHSMLYLLCPYKRDIYSIYKTKNFSITEASRISLVGIGVTHLYRVPSKAKNDSSIAECINFDLERPGNNYFWDESLCGHHIQNDGNYFIYVSIHKKLDENLDVTVKKNDEILFEILGLSNKLKESRVLSNSGIFHFHKNDLVKVRSNENSSFEIKHNLTSLLMIYLE